MGYRVVQRRLCVLREVRSILHGHIVDGTRYVHSHTRHRSLDEFTAYAAGSYRRDYWADSPVRVEVWLEKDALTGVLRQTVVDEEKDLPRFTFSPEHADWALLRKRVRMRGRIAVDSHRYLALTLGDDYARERTEELSKPGYHGPRVSEAGEE